MKSAVPREPRKVTIIPATPKSIEPGKSSHQKLRVAAYCRVSTDSEEQINSYKNQLAYYTEKINSKTEWKFAGVYADEGITGTSMKHREDFKRMLRACREGRIDLILCKSVSRFGRNSVDVLRTIRALRERGIRDRPNVGVSPLSSEPQGGKDNGLRLRVKAFRGIITSLYDSSFRKLRLAYGTFISRLELRPLTSTPP